MKNKEGYGKVKKTREELKSIIYLEIIINKRIEELEELRRTFKIPSYESNKIFSNHNGDLSSLMVKIEQQEIKINELLEKQTGLKNKWSSRIEKLKSPMREIVELYYFHKGYDCNKIGKELFYSPKYVVFLKNKAVRELAEMEG